jgi:ATP-dependent DNA helicase RecG
MGKKFSAGQKVMLYGRIELHKRLQISHPVCEIICDDEDNRSLEIGRIVPIYSITKDLSQKYMKKCVFNAMAGYLKAIDDPLPTYLRGRKRLVDTKFAIENIHFPVSFDNLEKAYKRLVFEEFFILQIALALKKESQDIEGIEHKVREGLLVEFEKMFPFEFTPDQKKCIDEIKKDMAKVKPMYRLLQGDVGSGKTVVAMYSLLVAVKGGYQAVIMAPTEVLARQHYYTISEIMMPLGIDVRLLIGGLDEKTKSAIRKETDAGDVDIIVGTHAVFQEGMKYKNIGLIVIDEQHKFGVEQRKLLKAKGESADTLVMTATPIPRSLALTVYGDMDLSFLKCKPVMQKPVSTYWVDEISREKVYSFIKEQVGEGRQVFIVYPRVKDDGRGTSVSAESMYSELKNNIFPDLSVGLVHGQMKAVSKENAMADFKTKKFKILVTTTLVEVGVDVPNATVMLVEQAHRYGLAQLHQLRGRIGRGKHDSYCLLMGDIKTEMSKERIDAIRTMDDGFEIAEKDLDIRGPGEFLGNRQSGLPELRFGNIIRDHNLMQEAREEAFRIVKEDPKLDDPRHVVIKKEIKERFNRD